MNKFLVERTPEFSAMLATIQVEFPRIVEPVDAAEKHLTTNAVECGCVVGKEGWRFYKTREVPGVMPVVLIFFYLDEDERTVRMMKVEKWNQA